MRASIIQINKFIKKIWPIFFWLFLWEMASIIINKEVYLPSPFSTLNSLFVILSTPKFYLSIAATIIRSLSSFLIALILGLILGFSSHFNNVIYKITSPIVTTIRSIPLISIVFFIVITFDSTYVPIVVSFLICFPIIWTSVIEGLKTTDNLLLDMCKIYKIKKSTKVLKVYFPSIYPTLASGMINSLGIGWKAIATAEAIRQPKHSIGRFLAEANYAVEVSDLIAWTVIIILLSSIFEKLLKLINKKVCYWRS